MTNHEIIELFKKKKPFLSIINISSFDGRKIISAVPKEMVNQKAGWLDILYVIDEKTKMVLPFNPLRN